MNSATVNHSVKVPERVRTPAFKGTRLLESNRIIVSASRTFIFPFSDRLMRGGVAAQGDHPWDTMLQFVVTTPQLHGGSKGNGAKYNNISQRPKIKLPWGRR